MSPMQTGSIKSAWLGQGLSLVLHLVLIFLGGAFVFQGAEFGVDAGEGGQVGGGDPQVLIAEVEMEEPDLEPKPEEIPPQPELETEPQVVEPESVKPELTEPLKPENKPQPTKKKTQNATPGQANNMPAASGSGGARVSVKPRYLRNPPPRYPSSSRRKGQQGTVVLSVDISTRGTVESLRVVRSSGHRSLDDEALRAVRRWKFQPATFGGAKIPSRARVPVVFRLSK
ncbi:MAG: energy transducer TonB [Verrucomicrobiota bacterium]